MPTEEIWYDYPTDSMSDGLEGESWYDYPMEAAKQGPQWQFDTNSPGTILGGSLYQLMSGIPFFDEGAAGVNALIDAATSDKGLSQAYNERLSQARGLDQALSEAYPGTSIAAKIAGGVGTLPLLPGGGVNLATRAGLAGTRAVGANVLGSALAGAGLGGLFGFSEGEGGAENRLETALQGAKFGGALGGAGSAVGQGLGAAYRAAKPLVLDIADTAYSKLPGALQRLASEEGGMIGGNIPAGAATPAMVPNQLEAALARQLTRSGLTTDELAASAAKLAEEVQGGNPTLLAEAVDMATGKPGLYAAANTIAARPEAESIAINALAAREADLPTRASKILDKVGTEASAWEVGENLKTSASKILDAAEETTKKEGGKAYEELYKTVGQVDNETVTGLLTEEQVQKAISRARKNSKELRDLPDNHFKVLERAYRYLRDDANKLLSREGQAPTEGGDLRKFIVNPLRDELDAYAPTFKAIRDNYGELMNKIKSISESGLSVLRNLKDNKLDDAVDMLFDQSPKQIKTLLDTFDTFAPEAKSLLKDAARVRLSKSAYDPESYAKVFKKWAANTPDMKEKLSMVLGKDAVEALNKSARREQVYQTAKGRYAVGSRTATRAFEEGQNERFLEKAWGLAKKPMKLALRGLEQAFVPRNEMLNAALAKAFFEPKTGLEALQRALPLAQKQIARRQQVLNAPDMGQALADLFATRPGGVVAGQNAELLNDFLRRK